MARIVRSEAAQEDLERILAYLDEQSHQAADRFATRLEKRCRVYAGHPQIGESSEVLAPHLRHFVVGNYAVFYRPVEGGIELVRIIHGARRLPRSLE